LIEIPTKSWHKVDIYVTKNDEAVVPTTTPTFSIKNLDTNSVIRTGTTTIDNDDVGHYYVQLTPNDTQYDINLEISWSYTLDLVTISDSEITRVYTPYVEVGEIITELGLGSEPQDPNYFPLSKLRTAERISRLQINHYTGAVFGLKEGYQDTFGNDNDTILFPEKMTEFTKLYQDDELVYDSETGYNAYGYTLELTQTGLGIRITSSSADDNSQIPPSAYYPGRTLIFPMNSRFRVVCTMGYKYVPIEVKQAAMLLINDHLYNDSLWRERYIESFDTGNMSLKFRDSAFTGTGNILVDDMLEPFKITGIVVI
jgi:hypothetical protein